jgi:3-deoxy-D-manno-octulosonic-acid transferase
LQNTVTIAMYQVFLCLGVLVLWPLWSLALLAVPKLRAGFFQKLGFWPKVLKQQFRQLPREVPVVWIHAVSVGEFLAIQPIVMEMKRLDMQPVVSCTTKTGFTLATDKLAGLGVPVFYFPFDFAWSVKKILNRVRPDLVLLTETELWPTFIHAVSQRKSASIQLINGRLSEKSFKGYQRLQFFMEPLLQTMQHCYMQSQADVQRMVSLMGLPDTPKVSVMGNLKFDITADDEKSHGSTDALYHVCGLHPGKKVLTMASTHEGEEALLIPVYYDILRHFPELALVLAPRHPERVSQVVKLLREETLQYRLLSELKASEGAMASALQQMQRRPVIVVDTIGDLKHMFAFSDLVVMAGSFLPHLGGHNVLEPMMANAPVLFGPYTTNFTEIIEVTKAYKAGIEVADVPDLKNQLVKLLTMPEASEQLQKNAENLLKNHQGQREVLLQKVCAFLNWPYTPR